jgi:cytochrome c oxidase subunit 4
MAGWEMTDHDDQHIQPYMHLLAVLVALLVLTAVTIWASGIELGKLNIWMTLLIASSKSSLVLLFFMHLKYEGRFIRTTFIVTVCTLAMLVGFLFWDVSFR